MSKFVERLKERANVLEAASAWGSQDGHLMASAASRIERLESALREMLAEHGDRHYHGCPADTDPTATCGCYAGLIAARAASALSQEETRC